MAGDYIPKKDGNLRTWLNGFVTGTSTYSGVLNVSPAEMTTISSASDAFAVALDNSELQKSAALGAVATKDQVRKDTVTLIRTFVREFQANPNITNEIRGALGITIPDDTRSLTPPEVPTDLTAFACSNGINQLAWNRGGNPTSGVQFVIEARVGGSPTWEFVDVVTASKYDHTGQTPGVEVVYRVYAKKRNLKSGYSNEAVVYFGGISETSLQLAA